MNFDMISSIVGAVSDGAETGGGPGLHIVLLFI
jgi:hypothetical protein